MGKGVVTVVLPGWQEVEWLVLGEVSELFSLEAPLGSCCIFPLRG